MKKGKRRYATKIKQPQTVGGVMLAPEGGDLSHAEYEAVEKDVYGATLLKHGMIAFADCSGKDISSDDPADGSSDAAKD